MITKNVTIEDVSGVTLVEMGTGDICICGIDWNEEDAHGIFFSQDVEKPIDKWDTVENPITSFSQAINPVLIRFTREESVDQVINSLIEVKNSFKK